MAFSTNDRRQIILDRLYELLGGLTIPLLGGPDGAVSIIPGNIVQSYTFDTEPVIQFVYP